VVGLALSAGAVHTGDLPLAFLADCFLGAGYGFGLVGGLLEVHRLAPRTELAGLTAVFYTLTYVGFAFPVLLTALTGLAGYAVLLAALAALAALSLVLLVLCSPRNPTDA
jgi:hypothetical protein